MSPAPISFKRTRIAPTPSGYLHIGNAYSFSLTAALARRSGASILLRIDDMDQERVDPAYLQDIFDTLQFLEIPWDEGPGNVEEFIAGYSQVHRLAQYEKALQQLREENNVFACSCSRQQVAQTSPQGIYPGTCRHKAIPLDAENVSWRLKTDDATAISLKTAEGTIETKQLPENMKDFIVRRRDGLPAYQLSSLVDDLYFEVDLVVRGKDLYDSSLAQLYLARQLDKKEFLDCSFYHHDLFLGTDEKKISKSAGDTSVAWLRQQAKWTKEDVYKEIGRLISRIKHR